MVLVKANITTVKPTILNECLLYLLALLLSFEREKNEKVEATSWLQKLSADVNYLSMSAKLTRT